MMPGQRRAFVLAEMLAILFMVAIGSTVMAVGIGAIMRTHKQTAALTNRYAVLHDFLRCIRKDVRAASRVTIDRDESATETILTLGYADADAALQRAYRFAPQRVERFNRSTPAGAIPARRDSRTSSLDKQWTMKNTTVSASLTPTPGGQVDLLNIVVQWDTRSKDDPQPRRRFALTLRPAGMAPYEP